MVEPNLSFQKVKIPLLFTQINPGNK